MLPRHEGYSSESENSNCKPREKRQLSVGQPANQASTCHSRTVTRSIRLSTAVAGFALGWGFCLALDDRGGWLVVLFWQCVATVLVCALLRWLRFRIERVSESSGAGENRLQFSIRHLFQWTTGVAIIIAVGRLVGLENVFRISGISVLAVYAPIFTLISVVALWAALGRESWISRILLSILALPMLGAIIAGCEIWRRNTGQWDWMIPTFSWGTTRFEALVLWVTWASLSGFLFAGLVTVFRGSGHRLVRV